MHNKRSTKQNTQHIVTIKNVNLPRKKYRSENNNKGNEHQFSSISEYESHKTRNIINKIIAKSKKCNKYR